MGVARRRLSRLPHAGHIPIDEDGEIVRGKLGENLTVEQGYQAARRSAIGLLASLKQEIGNLDRVVRVVKVLGMVNSSPSFVEQSSVVNGCSALLYRTTQGCVTQDKETAICDDTLGCGLKKLPRGVDI